MPSRIDEAGHTKAFAETMGHYLLQNVEHEL